MATKSRSSSRSSSRSRSGSRDAASPSKTILVVDDDKAIRGLVTRTLSPTYIVHEAGDALAASELIGHGLVPDLILLDVMMPMFDGFVFAERLKKDRKLENIPIIFVSARAAPADIIRGINAGARFYMTKPFTIEELRKKVGQVLA
jgi:CheY-like chemotaxis protein